MKLSWGEQWSRSIERKRCLFINKNITKMSVDLTLRSLTTGLVHGAGGLTSLPGQHLQPRYARTPRRTTNPGHSLPLRANLLKHQAMTSYIHRERQHKTKEPPWHRPFCCTPLPYPTLGHPCPMAFAPQPGIISWAVCHLC